MSEQTGIEGYGNKVIVRAVTGAQMPRAYESERTQEVYANGVLLFASHLVDGDWKLDPAPERSFMVDYLRRVIENASLNGIEISEIIGENIQPQLANPLES